MNQFCNLLAFKTEIHLWVAQLNVYHNGTFGLWRQKRQFANSKVILI